MSKLVAAMARATKAFVAGLGAAAGAYTVAYADGGVDSSEVGFIVASGIAVALTTYNVTNAAPPQQ